MEQRARTIEPGINANSPPHAQRSDHPKPCDELPACDTPFWLREAHPFAEFRSNERLPTRADVVIIGAGLAGCSAAYHLAEQINGKQLRIVVLDASDPASEASGRNGGQFGLIPQNSVGIYRGLTAERFMALQRLRTSASHAALWAEAARQARAVLRFCLRNRSRMSAIVKAESIDCDYSGAGWLYLARTAAEERGIDDEVGLAAGFGQRIEQWSSARVQRAFGFETAHNARYIVGDGTYHPFRYACGLLRAAIERGIELYTRTPVEHIRTLASGQHHIVTSSGSLVASRIIVATNAYTARLLPELSAISAHHSQIQVTEDAPDRLGGCYVTSDREPVYFSQPRSPSGAGRVLLMGGGADRPVADPACRRRSASVHRNLLHARDAYFPELRGRRPSAEWVGPIGCTPDLLPAVGTLRPGVVVAAGFCGYGGSYTTAAGEAAAAMALTGKQPGWLATQTFSPRRLLPAGSVRPGTSSAVMTAANPAWRHWPTALSA